MIGREHEAHASRLDALGNLWRREIDPGAQRFEHVGGTGFRRHTAIAVLGHGGAGGSGDEGRGCGNIERVGGITAGADDIDKVRIERHLDLGAQLAHHCRCCRDLADSFLLRAQAGKNCRAHQWRHFARHDHPHQMQHLIVEYLTMLDGPL